MRKIKKCVKRVLVYGVAFAFCLVLGNEWMVQTVDSYFSWFILAIKVALVVVGVLLFVSILFYREQCVSLYKKIRRK